MKFPKEIDLIGETFTIKILSQKEMDILDKTENETIGKYLPDEKELCLVKLEDKKEMENAFWHELGHYFFSHYCFKDNQVNAQIFSDFVRLILKQIELKGGKEDGE